MQTTKLRDNVVSLITGHGHSKSPALTSVRVSSKGGILREIVFDGGNLDQMHGVPDVYDGFEIPSISDIDTPSLRGVKLRTITVVPDGFRCGLNPQSGIWTASFGLKPPAELKIHEDDVVGYWNANGFVLAAYGNAGMSIAQLGNAVHKRDIAIYLGGNDDDIGCETLHIATVSNMSDALREKLLNFDNGVVEKRDSLKEDMRHYYGAGSVKTHAAKHEPAELAINDKQSA